MQGLLRGAALAVHRGAGHAFRQLGGQDGVAGDVGRLFAHLHHAAHDHVIDQSRVDAGAVNDLIQHAATQIGGVDAGKPAALAAACGARSGDDIGFAH